MTSETKATDKPGDPADKAADGAFGGVHSHRAGYGDDKLARLVAWLRAHPTTTLASGEGALLLAEIDRLRDDLHTQDAWVRRAMGEMDGLRVAAKDSADHYADARAEIDRMRRILAALREPSENVSNAVWSTWGLWDSQNHFAATLHALVRAAVIAAEQEVGGE